MKPFARILCLLSTVFLLGPSIHNSWAGNVKTKDPEGKCGGYRKDSYHLKGCDQKMNYDKDQGWHNPFKGATKQTHKKPHGTHEMPTFK